MNGAGAPLFESSSPRIFPYWRSTKPTARERRLANHSPTSPLLLSAFSIVINDVFAECSGLASIDSFTVLLWLSSTCLQFREHIHRLLKQRQRPIIFHLRRPLSDYPRSERKIFIVSSSHPYFPSGHVVQKREEEDSLLITPFASRVLSVLSVVVGTKWSNNVGTANGNLLYLIRRRPVDTNKGRIQSTHVLFGTRCVSKHRVGVYGDYREKGHSLPMLESAIFCAFNKELDSESDSESDSELDSGSDSCASIFSIDGARYYPRDMPPSVAFPRIVAPLITDAALVDRFARFVNNQKKVKKKVDDSESREVRSQAFFSTLLSASDISEGELAAIAMQVIGMEKERYFFTVALWNCILTCSIPETFCRVFLLMIVSEIKQLDRIETIPSILRHVLDSARSGSGAAFKTLCKFDRVIAACVELINSSLILGPTRGSVDARGSVFQWCRTLLMLDFYFLHGPLGPSREVAATAWLLLVKTHAFSTSVDLLPSGCWVVFEDRIVLSSFGEAVAMARDSATPRTPVFLVCIGNRGGAPIMITHFREFIASRGIFCGHSLGSSTGTRMRSFSKKEIDHAKCFPTDVRAFGLLE